MPARGPLAGTVAWVVVATSMALAMTALGGPNPIARDGNAHLRYERATDSGYLLSVVTKARARVHFSAWVPIPTDNESSINLKVVGNPRLTAKVVRVERLRGQALALVAVSGTTKGPVTQLSLAFVGRSRKVSGGNPLLAACVPFLVDTPALAKNVQQQRIAPGDWKWCVGSDWEDTADSVIAFGADYVMLVAAELCDEASDSLLIEQLADHRANVSGLDVAIVSMASIDATPDTSVTPGVIRDFLIDVYDSESANHIGDGRLAYLLLVGDARNPAGDVLIPGYYGFESENSQSSDAYYAALTVDPTQIALPDLLVGRLPIDDDGGDWELTNVVQKITSYEPLPANAAWTNRLLIATGGQDGGFTFQGMGGQGFSDFVDSVQTNFIPSNMNVRKMHRLTSGLSDAAFSSVLADSIKNGFGTAVLFDHAYKFYLAGQSGGCFLPSHYDTMTTSTPPFFFLCGTQMGSFDTTIDDDVCCGAGPCATSSLPGACVAAPATPIDSSDVVAERLLVQPGGGIAVLAYCRTQITIQAQVDFANFFRSVFAENNTTTGAVAFGMRFLQLGVPPYATLRGLTLFGDPALNLVWREGDSTNVDLRVAGLSGSKTESGTRYVDSSSPGNLTVYCDNLGSQDVEDAALEIWLGHPDSSGSTRLDSVAVDVPAFSTVAASLSLSGFGVGSKQVYTVVDRNGHLPETALGNNISMRTLIGQPYLQGFPFKLPIVCRDAVIVGEFSAANSGSEVIASGGKSTICVSSSSGETIWQLDRPSGIGNIAYGTSSKSYRPRIHYIGAPSSTALENHLYTLEAESGSVLDSLPVASVSPIRVATGTNLVLGDYLGNGDFMAGRIDFTSGQPTARVTSMQNGEAIAVPLSGDDGDAFSAGLAAGDVSGSGRLNLLIAVGSTLYIIDAQAGSITGSVAIGAINSPHSLVLVDTDNDAKLEIIVTGSTGSGNVIRKFDYDLSPQWTYPVGAQPILSVGRIDNGEEWSVVCASDSTLRTIDVSGSLIDSTVVPTIEFASVPVIGDLTSDSGEEIAIVSRADDVNIYLPFGLDDANRYLVHVFRGTDLATLAEFEVVGYNEEITGELVITDLNDDGIGELVFTSPDSVLHAFAVGSGDGTGSWPSANRDSRNSRVAVQPYKGTYDNITIAGESRFLGDVVADTVYIDSSARIIVDAEDQSAAGTDTALIELTVSDSLLAFGLSESPVYLGAHPDLGDSVAWYGITVDTLGFANISNLKIANAETGLLTKGVVELDAVEFRNGEMAGLVIASPDSSHGRNVTFSNFDASAVDITSGGTFRCDTCDVSTGGSYGVQVSSSGTFYATGGAIVGAEVGARIEGNATFNGLSIEDNDVGLEVVHTSGVTVTGAVFVDNASEAIALDGASILISGGSVTGSTTGIFCDDYSHPTIDGVTIQDNTGGITCDAYSAPLVTDCVITGGTVNVAASGDADPDLGGGGGSVGNNSIHGGSSDFVANLSAGITISAQNNFWNRTTSPCTPHPSKITGNVDTSSPLCSSPSLVVNFPINQPSFRTRVVSAHPNPFNPHITVDYEIDSTREVAIDIFNVRGQRVASLFNGVKTQGRYQVRWDGTNMTGAKVASGVYFVRTVSREYMDVRKIVLLK